MANLSEVLLRKNGGEAISTGVYIVDEDLAALHEANNSPSAVGSIGVPEHSVTEISGLPGSGKTALALSLIHDTVRKGFSVLYLGCDYRSFPWDRVRRLRGWNCERFDRRIHTQYFGSIEQLLTATSSADVRLVVVEHYDTLIKSAWSDDLKRRAAQACADKFHALSKTSCVIATSGCVKMALHEHVVTGPAVKIWRKPPNMARIILYRDYESDLVLSTGGCFRVADEGLIAGSTDVKAALLLPELSSRKRALKRSSPRSPKTEAPSYMLTPLSKRCKTSAVTDAHDTRPPCVSDPPSSPSDHKGKQSLLAGASSSHSGQKLISPIDSAHPNPCCDQRHQPSQFYDALSTGSYGEKAGSSHNSAPPTHDHASDNITLDQEPEVPEDSATKSDRNENFLGLEIIPNSQVDVNDADYLLRSSLP